MLLSAQRGLSVAASCGAEHSEDCHENRSDLFLHRVNEAHLLAVLVVVNAATYAATNYLALRGPMAFGYRPDTPVPLSSVFQGYPEYISAVLRGDLGHMGSGWFPSTTEVVPLIAESLGNSLILLVLSLSLAAVVGVGIGLLAVNPHTRRPSPLALFFSIAGFSMPGFYLGILILMIMLTTVVQGQRWTFLPVSGYGLDAHLILPVLTLAVRPAAEMSRLTAELLSEELGKEYIRAARAKGLSWRLVITRHAFRNIAATFVTSIGNSLSYLLGSLVIIEWVFHWPGLGMSLLDSISLNNFGGTVLNPMLIATLATTGTLLYLIVDLFTTYTSRALDPRLRRAQS
jgi:peptide/nickel transport system permease protein